MNINTRSKHITYSIQEKDKSYMKTAEGKQLQETKTCHACGLKEHLIKSCKKKNSLFVTNEEWSDISEEELKYFLEEHGKISSIKTRRNEFLERNEALVCYRTAEETKTALAYINVYQGWTAEMYKSTSKDEQIKVNEGYREEQNKIVERNPTKRKTEYKYQRR